MAAPARAVSLPLPLLAQCKLRHAPPPPLVVAAKTTLFVAVRSGLIRFQLGSHASQQRHIFLLLPYHHLQMRSRRGRGATGGGATVGAGARRLRATAGRPPLPRRPVHASVSYILDSSMLISCMHAF
jgi:hypothetical protein